ncbi:sarcocystatin-A-like [Cochliomyia hominivorax]
MFKLLSFLLTVVVIGDYSFSVVGQYLNNCQMSGYRMGGRKILQGPLLLEAEHELRTALMKIAEDDEGPFYRVGIIFGGTEHTVAGSLKTVAAELIDYNSIKHNCEVDMWTRPWLTDGTEVTIRCECMRTIFKHIDY